MRVAFHWQFTLFSEAVALTQQRILNCLSKLSFSELLMKTALRAYYLQHNNFLIQLHLHFIKGSSYLCGFQLGTCIISSEFDMFDNCVSGMDPVFRILHSFSSIHNFIYPSWKQIWKDIAIIERFDIAKECCNFYLLEVMVPSTQSYALQ